MTQTRQPGRARQGFTLSETMLAMLILAFVGMIATTGLMTGLNTYYDIVEKSNAELLLSTTISELRDELDRTEEISLTGTALTAYRSSTSGWRVLRSVSLIAEGDPMDKKGIWVREYKGYPSADALSAAHAPQLLVTEATATKGLYARFSSITYDETKGEFTISGLQVRRISDEKVLAEVSSGDEKEYKIRSLEKPTLHKQSGS